MFHGPVPPSQSILELQCLSYIHLEPQGQPFINGCLVISNHFLYKGLVHHRIETSIYKWLALGFQAIVYLLQVWFWMGRILGSRLGFSKTSFVTHLRDLQPT